MASDIHRLNAVFLSYNKRANDVWQAQILGRTAEPWKRQLSSFLQLQGSEGNRGEGPEAGQLPRKFILVDDVLTNGQVRPGGC